MPAAIECRLVEDSLGVRALGQQFLKLDLYTDKISARGSLRGHSLATIEGGLNILRPGRHTTIEQ